MGTISLHIQRLILRAQLHESRSAPRSHSVTRRRGNLSNNDLSRHLVGTLKSNVALMASIHNTDVNNYDFRSLFEKVYSKLSTYLSKECK